MRPRGVVGGATGKRPVVFAIALLDRRIVDTRNAPAHQAIVVEFPVFVAIAAQPLTAVVMPLIREPHRDAVVAEGPDFLDQAIVQLALPFPGQKSFDRLPSLQKLGAISPLAVCGIRLGYRRRIARVPCIFSQPRFLRRGLAGEGWNWRSAHDNVSDIAS